MVLGDEDRAAHARASLTANEGTGARRRCDDGAMGVSTSLQYAPAPYAKTEELIALAGEAAQVRRHLRHPHAQRRRRRYGGARRSDSHRARGAHSGRDLAPQGRRQAATGAACRRSSRKIEQARAIGVDIAADTYAYPAWFNDLLGIHPAVGA